MTTQSDLYHGLFQWHGRDGEVSLSRHEGRPSDIPCPKTGRPLRVATIDAEAAVICPQCSSLARGGFVSFVADLAGVQGSDPDS